jgi:uncharacterized protein YabN with tetrapyrrole methylase and pyrophosphatase domain
MFDKKVTGENMDKAFMELAGLVKHATETCPWHQKQTYTSFMHHLAKEAGEIIEAIAQDDAEWLAEELGDMLWNVLFVISLAEKDNIFNTKSVLHNTYEKFKERQPHLFREGEASIEKIESVWKEVKQQEKERKKGRKKISLKGTSEE